MYKPLPSDVVVPIVLRLWFWSRTLMVTGTPVMLFGHCCCWYTNSIQLLSLASDTHGKPLGKFDAVCCCVEPAEISITVPRIVTGVLVVTPTSGAVTVVSLGPLPKQYSWLSYAFRETSFP